MCVRLWIVLLCTIASFLMYAQKLNLSIAILAMVNGTAIHAQSEQASFEPLESGCPIETNNSLHRVHRKEGIFLWTPSMQGIILGAYFYGYTATQVFGGRWAEKWGGKWVCGLGILGASLASFLIPISANYFIFICAIRVIIGAFHGLVYSSVYNIFMRWVPDKERVTALAFMFSAGHIGAFVILPLTSFLCESSIMGGWPSAFYFSATAGCLWSLLWFLYVTDSPANHSKISKFELNIIKSGTQQQTERKPLQWSKLLMSTAVWSAVIAKTTSDFGYYVISNELPLYLESVLHVNIEANGYFNAFASLVLGISTFSSGKISNYIGSKQFISLTSIRKIFQGIAGLGPMICLLLVPLAGCDKQFIVALIVVSMFFLGFLSGGESPIVTEFAPSYSGTIFGFANFFASIGGILAPLFVGVLLNENVHDKQNWNLVFYVSAAVYAFGGLFFAVFATAEPTEWGSDSCAVEKREVSSERYEKKTDSTKL